jgi:cytoskeletal protein RodZ
MSNSNNPLDKAFRDKLKDHEINPSDHIWEDISKAVDKKSRRLWLILAPILLAIAAAIFYFVWSSDKGSIQAEQEGIPEVEHTDQQAGQSRDIKSEDLRAESYKSENNQSSKASAFSSTNSSTSAQSTTSKTQTSQTTTAKTTASSQKSASNVDYKLDNKTNTAENETAQTGISTEQKLKQSSAERAWSQSNNAATRQSDTKAAFAQESEPRSKDATGTIKSKSQISYSRPVFEAPVEFIKTDNDGIHRFEVARFKAVEKEQREILTKTDQCALLYPKTNECPEFKDLNRRFQFDVYGLIGKKFSTLSTNDDIPGLGEYLNARRTSETALWNIGLGVRLSTQWTSGVSLRGGLEISRGQIRLNYDDESQKRVVVTVTQDTIVDGEGNITIIQDTTSITETNIIPVEDFNNFTQLDIPLTVGYTFLGREYDIELNAGVMFNLLFEKSGMIFNAEDELKNIDPSANESISAYRQQLGLSLITSAAINYHLTEQFSVFAEPQLRYFLKPVSPELYELKESWFHFNLMLGGRYSF